MRDSFLKAMNRYEAFLNEVSEEQFLITPPTGGWSFSEVYSHILVTNLLSLKAIEKCIEGTAEKISGGTPLKALPWLILGFFPPGKYRAPKAIAEKVTKISKEEAQGLIEKNRHRMQELSGAISSADRLQKIKHPRFGYLNARDWKRFLSLHSNHHLKQLDRIKKNLRENNLM